MKAIHVVGRGRSTHLVLGETPLPRPRPGELRIRVVAAGVNRGDLLQRRGLYPPLEGATPILGLECAGRVDCLGSGTSGFAVGDRVMALLPGGGYAEHAVAHAGSVMRVPDHMALIDAAGVPEVFLTCHLTLFRLARCRPGEVALVQGGGSGIGTAAIQLLRCEGLRVITTAGTDQKCSRCLELGADRAVNYRRGSFAAAVLEATEGSGVDVILDHVGGAYLEPHLRCLAPDGRLVLIGAMQGTRAEIDLGTLLARRLSIIASTLRSRSVEEKARIVEEFSDRFGARLGAGEIRAVVDSVLPLAEAQRAHDHLQASRHFGKVVLRVSEE